MSATLDLPDAGSTEAVGARLAGALQGGIVVTLSGELGAGKTTLVRGCLRGLGWTGPVKSPSYALVEHYEFSSLYFYHFDFYRFADPSEWDSSGFGECFRDDSVCVIEWPERLGDRLPPPDLHMTLVHPDDPQDTGRRLELVASSEAGERCLSAIVGAARS